MYFLHNFKRYVRFRYDINRYTKIHQRESIATDWTEVVGTDSTEQYGVGKILSQTCLTQT